MKKTTKTVIVLLVLAMVFLWWIRRPGSEQDVAADDDLYELLDRPWIDSMPDRRTDYMQVFYAISEQPIGIVQRASDYRAEAELFFYTSSDNSLNLHFPQSNKTKTVTFKVHKCGDLPPFDLCLDFKKSPWGNVKRYYSYADEDSLDGLRALTTEASQRVENLRRSSK